MAGKIKQEVSCRLQDLQSERDIKSLIDSLPFYVLLVDTDHCVVLANKAAEKGFGKKLLEIQGGYCPAIVHGMNEPFPGCPLEESLVSGKPEIRELYDKKNNSWVSSAVYPSKIMTTEGKYIYFHTATDITAHKLAENALRESEKKYRSLFDNASEGIVQTLPDGTITAANMAFARMMGFDSPDELKKKIPSMSKIYARSEQLSEKVRQLHDKKNVDNLEMEITRLDGKSIWVSIDIHMVREDKNGSTLFEGLIIDITERKKAENQANKNFKRLELAFHGLIEALALTLETRDPYTASHQRKVAELSCVIAREMGLSEDKIESLNMAAMVHDVGKIYVPSEILNKPGKLTDLEFDLIKTHVDAGYNILKDIEFRDPVAEMVRQHHERLDGSGYPQGLKDGKILQCAKIMAVADVVEAMSTHRPYRPALGIDIALEEVEKNKGKLYNPDVVDTCVTLFTKKGFTFSD